MPGIARQMLPAPTMTPMVSRDARAASSAARAAARRHQHDAEFHHSARAGAVHQPADQRANDGGHHEAERKCAGGDAALPAESSMIGGNNSENAVRALTPIAMVTKVTATMTQP